VVLGGLFLIGIGLRPGYIHRKSWPFLVFSFVQKRIHERGFVVFNQTNHILRDRGVRIVLRTPTNHFQWYKDIVCIVLAGR